MIIRSKTPLRISFAGGGTDVSPYIEDRGGIVLNATIDKYTYATLVTRADDLVNVKSLDYNTNISFNCNGKIEYDGNLDLVKAAVKTLKIKSGLDLFLHTDAAPGTGLGSSSTLTTAIIGVFRHWLGLHLTNYQVAELAYQIERVEVGIKGGKQDQYAATFGGVNFIEFFADKTVVNPLRIKAEVLNELEYRLLLYNVGRSRSSAEIIDDQVASYTQRKKDVVSALDESKIIAVEMKKVLLLNRVDEIGYLLDEGWKIKKRFSSKITNPLIDEFYDLAKKHGAIGGKLLGAGGGGHLLLLCNYDKKHQVAAKLKAAGGYITPFAFEFRGLQTWEVPT